MNQKQYENILLKKFLAVAIVGIFVGVAIECIFNNQRDSLVFLNTFNIDKISKTEINFDRLLCVIIEKRISIFILILFLGLTSGGKSIVNIFLFWNCSCLGVFLAQMIKYRFLKGLLCFFAMFLPQYLFYVPALFMAYYQISIFSSNKYDAKNISNKLYVNRIVKYMISFSFVLLLILIGILAETYINPVLVKTVVKKM